MPKITATDISARGFRAEQFGLAGASDAEWAAFLDPILEHAGTWASQQYGTAAYAAPSRLDLMRLKNAEAYYASAELWRRRVAYIDGNAAFALEDGARIATYEKLAAGADAAAVDWLNQACTTTGTLGPSIAGVVVESGRGVSDATRTVLLS